MANATSIINTARLDFFFMINLLQFSDDLRCKPEHKLPPVAAMVLQKVISGIFLKSKLPIDNDWAA
jgi:hypothetical protein